MKHRYKVGDYVICVTPAKHVLIDFMKLNSIHQIIDVHKEYQDVKVGGCDYWWTNTRFKKIKKVTKLLKVLLEI